jgi:hypothetical protein
MPNVGSRGNGIYYVRDQYEPPFDIFREVQLEPNIYGYEGV